MAHALGKLSNPPITEVVCGVLFRPVPGLDPVSLGAFWKANRERYPRREFKAPIAAVPPEGFALNLGPDVGPLRTWLISKDDVFILQVQSDRFYLNWRARKGEYPRFNDREGRTGLLSRFLSEYAAFESFCEAEFGTRLDLQGIELAKIDHLERGRHWKDPRDLGVCLPMLTPAMEFATDDVMIATRLATPRENGSIDFSIESALKVAQPPIPIVKLETRRAVRSALTSTELEGAFKTANSELNDLFVRLIPTSQHHRFQKEGEA